MRKFTPGPWYAVGYWVEHPEDDRPDICSCNPFDIGQDHLERSDEEIRANVQLIAAAPDLLDALQKLVGYLDGTVGDYHLENYALPAARSAVAKAIGGER